MSFRTHGLPIQVPTLCPWSVRGVPVELPVALPVEYSWSARGVPVECLWSARGVHPCTPLQATLSDIQQHLQGIVEEVDAKVNKMALLKEGECFGEAAILSGDSVRTHTVVSVTSCVFFLLANPDFL